MTSDARARPREEENAVQSADPSADTETTDEPVAPARAEEDATTGGGTEKAADEPRGRRPRRAARGSGNDGDGGDRLRRSRPRPALPLVPVLAVLLVLLLGAVGYLWFSRPEASAIRTDDYTQVLQAARSGVVDMTSFDYLTLDDDLEQIRRVTTGDLRKEAIDQLDSRRQPITDAQAVVNTEVIGAGVTRAGSGAATVLLVIQSTQKSTASPQAQVTRYRIQVELKKMNGRWLLSGITGAGSNE